MILTLQIVAALLIISGLVLNTYKKRVSFLVWACGSCVLICLYSISKLYVIVSLQVILIILDMIGWFKWKT